MQTNFFAEGQFKIFAPVKFHFRHRVLLALFAIGVCCSKWTLAQTFTEVASGTHNMTGIAASIAATSGSFVLADFEGNDGDLDLLGRNTTNNGLVFWRHNGNATNWTQLSGASNPFNSITYGVANANNFTAGNIAVLDADNDGDLDVYNRGTNELYRNGSGTFTVVTGASNPMNGIAATLANATSVFLVADFDGDGDKDLVGRPLTLPGSLVFWRNNAGVWSQITGAANPFNGINIAAAGDFSTTNLALVDADGNGSIDIYNRGSNALIKNTAGTYAVATGAGNPMDAIAATLAPFASTFITADLDSDGDLDVLGRNASSNGLTYWQKGAGSVWTQLTGANNPFNNIVISAAADFTQLSVGVVDVEKDGDADVFNNGKQSVYRQEGVAPTLNSFTPILNATNVLPASNLSFTFSEAVKLGSGAAGSGSLTGTGDFTIRLLADNSLLERVNVVTNAARISGAGTTTLTIDPVSLLPPGVQVYVEIGSNAVLSNTSNLAFQGVNQTNVIRFSTLALPIISGQPAAVTSCLLSGVSFGITASGTGISWQWQQSDQIGFASPTVLANAGVYSGVNTATLAISDNSGLGGKYFRCVVTNGAGSVNSSPALLTTTTSTLPASAFTLTQNVSSANLFQNGSCSLLGRVVPNGASPIAGNATFKSWVQPTVPIYKSIHFVQRHYEILPSANAGTATGRVTLYFSQADFDAFNNSPGTLDLPANPTDNNGKQNLRISKLSGTSSDGSGLPQTYPGIGELINPADADIVWNPALLMWEVSFDAIGFSGFFVQTTGIVLPISVITFSATPVANGQVKIVWKVAEQEDVKHYAVQRSFQGNAFETVAVLQNTNDVNYGYLDDASQVPYATIYYRLKILEKDGKESFSKVVAVRNNRSVTKVLLFPNPVRQSLVITVPNFQKPLLAKLHNMQGQVLKTFIIASHKQTIDLSNLAAGIYQLKLEDGTLLRVVKE